MSILEWETSQPPPSRRVHQVPSLFPPLHLPTLSNWPPVPRLRLRPSGLPARYCLLTVEPSQLVLQPRPTFNPWKEKQTSEQPHFHEYKSANPSPPASLVTQRPFSSPASSEHEQGRQHFSPPPKSVSQDEMEDEGSQHRSRLSKTWGSDGYETHRSFIMPTFGSLSTARSHLLTPSPKSFTIITSQQTKAQCLVCLCFSSLPQNQNISSSDIFCLRRYLYFVLSSLLSPEIFIHFKELADFRR